MEKYR